MELRTLLVQRDFWFVNVHFMSYIAAFNTFDAIEGSLLIMYGYSEALSSPTAVAFAVVGVLSTALEACILQPEHYRLALLGTNGVLGVACLAGIGVLSGGFPGWSFVAVVGFMGLSTPGWGCSVELGSEVCYPAREATVTALMEACASLASVGGIVGAQWLIDSGRAVAVLPIMGGCCFAGCFALAGLSGRLRRTEAELQINTSGVLHQKRADVDGCELP